MFVSVKVDKAWNEISTVIRALNSVGERAEPCGEPVVSGSNFTP